MAARRLTFIVFLLAAFVLTVAPQGTKRALAATPLLSQQPVKLAITTEGLYRLTYAQLLTDGIDISGATVSTLGLEDTQGSANTPTEVPIYISSSNGATMGSTASDYIEFYAHPGFNTYTSTNYYVLTDSDSSPVHVSLQTGLTATGGAPDTTGMWQQNDMNRTFYTAQMAAPLSAQLGTIGDTDSLSWPTDGDTNWVEWESLTNEGGAPTQVVHGFKNITVSPSGATGTCTITAQASSFTNYATGTVNYNLTLALYSGATTSTNPFTTGLSVLDTFTDTWSASATSPRATPAAFTHDVPCSDLTAANNIVTFSNTYPSPAPTYNTFAGTGGYVESYTLVNTIHLSYGRTLCASSNPDELGWQPNSSTFTVAGFSASPDIWRINGDGSAVLYRPDPTATSVVAGAGCNGANNTTSATVTDPAGTSAAEYYASSFGSATTLQPASVTLLDQSLLDPSNNVAGSAQYLVILGAAKDGATPFSTSEFTTSPSSLPAAYSGSTFESIHPGLTYKYVTVNQIYDAYGYGQYDPVAIRKYVQYAAASLGTEYVLLVGGDLEDYHSFSECHSSCPWYYAGTSKNLIPTYYVYDSTTLVPSDNLFAVSLSAPQSNPSPDVAIGRLPVFTATQLDNVLEKSINFAAHMPETNNLTLWPAGPQDGNNFQGSTNTMYAWLTGSGNPFTSFGDGTCNSATVSNGYAYECTTVDTTARTNFINGLQNGTVPSGGSSTIYPDLVNYNGHGNAGQWSSTPMLKSSTVVSSTGTPVLTNSNASTGLQPLIIQWGCNVALFTHPQSGGTIDDDLVVEPNAGATLALGSTGEDFAFEEETLAGGISGDTGPDGNGYLYGYLSKGYTIGQAMTRAKDDVMTLYSGSQTYVDVVDSYEILGDPALSLGLPIVPTIAVVSKFVAVHTGATKVKFTWKVASNTGITGFDVYAGSKRLNAAVIPVHTSRSYHLVTTYHGKKPFTLRTILQSGAEITTALTSG
jgi:hypothetical protein